MPKEINPRNLQRATLEKLKQKDKNPLISLRLAYSEYSHLLNNFIKPLMNVERIYPTFLPTQSSFRWSTLNPPITNWPRACINPKCQERLELLYSRNKNYNELGFIDHEWTDECWSIRDVISQESNEYLLVWDHDNIEGKIHDIIINNKKALLAHRENLDLHTITCCQIFGMQLPKNLKNPHTSIEDEEWRKKYKWQGKDTKIRVLSKNFNHGSKYTDNYKFVYEIKDIEKFGVSYKKLETLAKKYILSLGDAWNRKLEIMNQIRKKRFVRTLYGARRIFFESTRETAKEGFSTMISGTVSHYNNMTLIMLEEKYGDIIRLVHNAHDGDKIAINKEKLKEYYNTENPKEMFMKDVKSIIEREISYQERSLIMTAGIKLYD